MNLPMISLAVLSAAASVPLDCGDSRAALRALDERVGSLVPGLPFAAVRDRLGAPAMDEQNFGRAPKTVPWLAFGKNGRHMVVQWVECSFDAEDKLTGCLRSGDLARSQTVTLAEWQRIRKGQRQSQVTSLLCAPETTTTMPNGDLRYSYMVTMPSGYSQRMCGGTVIIRKGRVAATKIACL